MGEADLSSKQALHMYARAWAEWVLAQQQEPLEIEAELSGDFQFIGRATDSLLQVRGPSGQFLLLTELQTHLDPDMPLRMLAYVALARQKYRLDVYAAVVYFLPPPGEEPLARAYHREFMGQLGHQDFQVIPIWELSAEAALNLNNPAILPFVPLMRGGAEPDILRQCVSAVHQQPNAAELEVLLVTFARMVVDTDLINRLLRWDMLQLIRQSPFYQEALEAALIEGLQKGLEEGREKGLEEGLQKGVEEGLQKGLEEGRERGVQQGREEGREASLTILRRLVAYRFQVGQDYFDERFQPLDLAAITRLGEVAFEVEDLAAFERELARLEAETAPDSDVSPPAE